MKKRAVFLIPVLLLALIMSGCGSHPKPGTAPIPAEPPPLPESGAPVGARSAIPTENGKTVSDLTERKLVVDVNMDIVVEDVAKAEERVEKITSKYGGYVASASLSGGEGEKSGSMTLRIPAANLDDALKEISGTATEVERYSRNTKDVTAQYVDYKARLENLEAAEKELRAMLEDVRKRPNASAKDILDVYDQLVKIRGQIDSVKGQLKVLEKLVAYSTVHLTLTQAVKPLPGTGWQPGRTVRAAVHALIVSLRWIADAFIWTVIYVIPVLVILAIPLALVVYLVKRLLRRKGRNRQAKPE